MNGFFQFVESIVSECGLSELTQKFPGCTLDYKELDKPIMINKENRASPYNEQSPYKENLGYSNSLMDKLTLNEDGTFHLKTINEGKEGTEGENGVKYVSKTLMVNGTKFEGVFPAFDSRFDTLLPDGLLKATDSKQTDFCNDRLKDAVDRDPKLAKKFTSQQLEQIKNGDTPDGYTWHHNEEVGKMQLVKTDDHQANRHTGGRSIWGGGTGNR